MQTHHDISLDTRDKLIGFSDALEIIGVSRSTAYRLIASDQMPRPVKIGSLTFFSERELQSWISEKLARRDVDLKHSTQ